MGASSSVAVFWFGEFDFPPSLLVAWRALSLGFKPFSLMKKSLVFRNSKFGSNATGSGVTFSTTFGSSRAPFPGAETAKKVKIRSAAANLIFVIKGPLEPGVNAQPTALIGIMHAMELPQIGK
jgi:hypothetical protein